MSPQRALAYISAFDLPPDEANSLIECDVRGKSYTEACTVLGMSPETIKRCRRRAFAKIADAINHNEALPG